MIFEFTRPVAAGYFQCDLSVRKPPYDHERQAALLYMTSGQGVWTLGQWKFPVRRGDMFAIPRGLQASGELNPARPVGYYYCYFELMENATGANLTWPWDLGPEVNRYLEQATMPCASGPFRPEVAGLFRTLQYELGKNSSISQLAAKAQLTLLGVNFGRMLALNAVAVRLPEIQEAVAVRSITTSLPEPVARAVDYVQSRLDQELSLAELAGVARCSERRFVDVFRGATGMSPMAFVRERRVREAKRLLMSGLSVKDVANRLNFADAHHFSRVFRQTTGISPTEYVAGKPPLRQRPSGEFSMAPSAAPSTH